MTYKFTKKNKGFTVVEILVTLFILTLIGIAVVNFQIDIFSLNRISNNNLVIQEDARQALKNMTAEIRSMSPGNDGSYPISLAATSSLTFYDDADNDSLNERIHYYLSGTTLKKGTLKPTGSPLAYTGTETTKEIVHNIANATTSIFSYYDTSYDGTSAALAQPVNILSIRLVKVNLIIDDNLLKSPPPLNMTTQVSIRNIKDNL